MKFMLNDGNSCNDEINKYSVEWWISSIFGLEIARYIWNRQWLMLEKWWNYANLTLHPVYLDEMWNETTKSLHTPVIPTVLLTDNYEEIGLLFAFG